MNRWDLFAIVSILLCIGLIALGISVGGYALIGMGAVTLVFMIGWWASIRVRIPALEAHRMARAQSDWGSWRGLADALDLTYTMPETPPYRPDLTGTYRDHTVYFTTFPSEDQNTTGVIVRLTRPTQDRLLINRKRSRAPEFEKRYRASSDPAALIEWLLASDGIRDALMALPPAPIQLRLRRHEIGYYQAGYEHDTTYLTRVLDLLIELAILIERPREV